MKSKILKVLLVEDDEDDYELEGFEMELRIIKLKGV